MMRMMRGWRYMRGNRNALMARSAAAMAGENAITGAPARRMSVDRARSAMCDARRAESAMTSSIIARDQPAHQFMGAPRRLDRGIAGIDLGEDRADAAAPRASSSMANMCGAQAVVDVVGIIGDVVGDGAGLRLGARKTRELEVVAQRSIPRSPRDAARGWRPTVARRRRRASGPLCLTRPSSVSQVRLRPSKSA